MREPNQILVVDDDPDIRETLRMVLSTEGHTTVCVSNGREALAFLRSSSATTCVIFLDLMMPVMNGFQFRAEQLRDPRLSEIPVVVITAAASDAAIEPLHPGGVIRKPFSYEELMKELRRWC